MLHQIYSPIVKIGLFIWPGEVIRTLRNLLIEKDIPFTNFVDTMVEGTYAEQHDRTLATPELELDYYGICFFMNSAESRELTKKFSLYN